MYSFNTIFHHVLIQEIGHSSLCCTVVLILISKLDKIEP